MRLTNCSIFDGLTTSGLESLEQHATPFTVPAGIRVFETSNQCQMMPIITSGSIRVFAENENGREITLYRVNSEQLCILTISCLLSGDLYPASSITESEVSGVTIPKSVFLTMVAQEPKFREQVFYTFSYRITHLMQLVDEVAFKKLDKRLAQYLLEHGPILTQSHQAIADELGSVREMISRLLKQFEDKGLLILSRKQIQLAEPEQLKQLVFHT